MKGGFLVDCQAKTDDSRREAKENDILVSVAGKIGDMCVVDHTISLGRAAMAYTVKDIKELTFLYMSLKVFNKKLQTISTGSIQKVINNNNIKDLNIAYNKEIVSKFSDVTIDMFEKMKMISKENRKLIKLKEYLLPLLMNGQINVDDIEI